jgi:hypothetical protein
MTGYPITAVMVRETMQRNLNEPPREPRARRRVRPAAARALQTVAHRLDPHVASPAPVR